MASRDWHPTNKVGALSCTHSTCWSWIGRDLRRNAWEARLKALAGLLHRAGESIRLSEHMDGVDGPALAAGFTTGEFAVVWFFGDLAKMPVGATSRTGADLGRPGG